jgi:hypothetical protein
VVATNAAATRAALAANAMIRLRMGSPSQRGRGARRRFLYFIVSIATLHQTNESVNVTEQKFC